MNSPGLFYRFINWFPIPLTHQEGQLRQVKKLITAVCTANSTCVDIGAYKGFYLNLMIQAAPQGTHIAFEPVPKNFNQLLRKYSSATRVYKIALSDEKGVATFYHTLENSSYSGLKKLIYPRKIHLQKLEVETDVLDNMMHDAAPALIKLTVQGAELRVLKGAANTIRQHQPIIYFMPDSSDLEMFQCSPEAIFDYLSKSFQYKIFTIKSFLTGAKHVTRLQFSELLNSEKKSWYVAAASNEHIKVNPKHS